jgi:plastocyanin
MAIQRKISINKKVPPPPKVTFAPNPSPANALDQIFWTNYDSEAHWPGLLNADGTINKTFFMPNQIAPDGDSSPIFSPSSPASFTYACSIHPDERGIINVT